MRRILLLLALVAACQPKSDAMDADVRPPQGSVREQKVSEPIASGISTAALRTPDAGGPAVAPTALFVPVTATAANVDWVRTLKREKTFRTIDIASPLPIDIVWRKLPEHTATPLPPDQDFPGNHPSVLALELMHGSAVVDRIALGEHSGMPWVPNVSYCEARKYRTPPTFEWTFPRLPNLVSAYSVGITQGSTDFVLVRGPGVMHLLHRFTSDGECPKQIHQGPLTTCNNMVWAWLAEIHLPSGTPLRETVIVVDGSANAANPPSFDCRNGVDGEQLAPP